MSTQELLKAHTQNVNNWQNENNKAAGKPNNNLTNAAQNTAETDKALSPIMADMGIKMQKDPSIVKSMSNEELNNWKKGLESMHKMGKFNGQFGNDMLKQFNDEIVARDNNK